jgi:16S rRNA (cytosine967-C5)-methyltransferase
VTRRARAPRPYAAAPARVAAWRTLARVRAGATLADAVAKERESLRDGRDRALAHDLATGVLRWRSALDAALESASSRPVARLDPDVLDILRLGVYQLRHRDRLPAHAVVSDAVAMARLANLASAAGFVNAVLRRLAAAEGAAPLDDAGLAAAGVEALAVGLAHPAWLVSRWTARLGIDTAIAWMRFDNQQAPLTLRVLPAAGPREAAADRLAASGVAVTPARWSPSGLVVTDGNPLDGDMTGFIVQDEASQLVGDYAAAWPARRRLDVCAAPGGKTLALSADPAALVVAGDRRPRRVRLLRDTLARAGAGHVPIVQHDAAGPLPYRDAFDLVLVDAPCSGLGTLRREPDLKWRRLEADLAPMAALQGRMLAHAARAVAPDGVLVYATCSSEPDENDAVADAFLAAHPAFEPAGRPPAAGDAVSRLVTGDGRLHTSPAAHGLEAFFAASFRRRR